MPKVTSDRIALVTGGGSGIGRSVAEGLASVQSAYVYVLDKDAEAVAEVVRQITSAGGRARGFVMDLANYADLPDLISEMTADFGMPNILVNNAAIAGMVPAVDCPMDQWEATMAVNVTAPMLLMQHVLPSMCQGQWGRIVNIASISALRAGTGRMPYGTSKAALIAMSAQFAVEVAEWGVTVNVIAPGPIDTPLARSNHTPETRAMYGQRVPMQRYGTSAEVAAGVLFFASEQASYITGQTLAVDGGFVASGVLVPGLFKAPNVEQTTALA